MSFHWLARLAVLVFVLGCSSGPIRQLHSLGGNEFTLFPEEGPAPTPITCSGDAAQRFGCFRKEALDRVEKLDVAGALAVTTPDGTLYTLVRTDSLNERERTITEDTPFPAASVTKMFLAAASVSLSEAGSVDLQQPISRYLPELTSQAGVGRATLHQLLTHTAGLGNPPQCEKGDEDLASVLEKYGNAPLWSPPGALSNYSNLGYAFVALVLERVTGKRFEDIVRERVLVPAGIPSATFGPQRVQVLDHHPSNAVLTRCRAMWPSGGLVLSVRELAHWASELARPDSFPLGRPLLELLTTPYVKHEARPGSAYGYGIGRELQSGLTVFNHSGRLEGFSAFVGWIPERQLAVAAFANTPDLLPVAGGLRALSTFASISENWQAARVPAHPLSAYTGEYVDHVAALRRLRVSLEDGHLVIDYPEGVPALLPPGFRFEFEPGAARARYVVSPIGVGERVADASGGTSLTVGPGTR